MGEKNVPYLTIYTNSGKTFQFQQVAGVKETWDELEFSYVSTSTGYPCRAKFRNYVGYSVSVDVQVVVVGDEAEG